jgi:ornithine cyclodeaminase
VVVGEREAALAEAGEVIAAVKLGLLAEDKLTELGHIVNGDAPGRTTDDQITVFKSVGLAVQDLVAAARAVERAERSGLGSLIAF